MKKVMKWKIEHLFSLAVWPKCLDKFGNFEENISDTCDKKQGKGPCRGHQQS